jgi:hypothetical protein
MKTKKLLLGAATAAALAVFNPAFAGGDKSAGANAETDAKAGVSTPSAPAGASVGIGAGASGSTDANLGKSQSGASADTNAGAGASADVKKDRKSEHGAQHRDSKEKQGTNRY